MTTEKHTEPNPETDFVCMGQRFVHGVFNTADLYPHAYVEFKTIPGEAGFADDDFIIFESWKKDNEWYVRMGKRLKDISEKSITLCEPIPIPTTLWDPCHRPTLRSIFIGTKTKFRTRIAKKTDDEYITQEDTITESVTFYWPSPIFKRICLYV